VGNILEIVEQPACTPGPVVLENQTVTTAETFVSCTTIEAGSDFRIESPGDVTFNAPGTIALKSGFSVGNGARFVAGSGALPELSRRTYTYQAPQYFLTEADGPWGTLDWSYDKTGNRLAETRNGATDTYVYATNGSGGNTPILDLVNLAVMGTRDYTWGAAGNLEEVDAAGNVIDFESDAEGRLATTTRAIADVSAGFSYDGRSFLTRAVETTGDPPAEAASIEAVYDSGGLLHALRRKASPSDPDELVLHLYLASRPVAQVAIDGAGAETWTYFTTDHLGTPLLATDGAGAVTWEGGLEPFGRDYKAGTPAGASESGIYLRLPGQWFDPAWADATSGAGIYQNVNRWYEVGVGRYTRADPWGVDQPEGMVHLYIYAENRPLILVDPEGLFPFEQFLPPWQDALDCFYCLLSRANFGFNCSEEAAWLTVEIGDSGLQIGCQIWKPTHAVAETGFRGVVPGNLFGQAHTHPTRCPNTSRTGPRPSGPDRELANTKNIPVYTISPDAIWVYWPNAKRPKRVAPSNWTDGPKERNCEPCDGIPQP
jgi:RHS repeat-associated protein